MNDVDFNTVSIVDNKDKNNKDRIIMTPDDFSWMFVKE